MQIGRRLETSSQNGGSKIAGGPRLRLLSTATAQQRGAALATATAPGDTAISLDGVSVRLGDRLALAGITARVRTGAFVGLLGPNGSGKSTLLRARPRILPPPRR